MYQNELMNSVATASPNRVVPQGGMPEGLKLPFMSRFMTIKVNEEFNRVELHLRGHFDSPFNNTNELTDLHELASKFPTLMIFINSPGGRVDLFLELYNIAKMFRSVITVACSEVCSAGFMLWAIGDVRVVQKHAEIMAHREAYGFGGKTDQHVDMVMHQQKRFERIAEEIANGILTEVELASIRYTEIWLTDEDMIERGAAISWSEFLARDQQHISQQHIVTIEGRTFLVDPTGNVVPVSISIPEDAQSHTFFDVIYHRAGLDEIDAQEVPEEEEEPQILLESATHSLTDASDESADAFLWDYPHLAGSIVFNSNFSEGQVRKYLKRVFGPSVAVVRKNGNIELHLDLGIVNAGNYKTGEPT